MRNPERIHRICSLLEAAWFRTPDCRFGQLLENLVRFNGLFPHSTVEECRCYPHLWAQEDDVTERRLEQIVNPNPRGLGMTLAGKDAEDFLKFDATPQQFTEEQLENFERARVIYAKYAKKQAEETIREYEEHKHDRNQLY